jgi:quinol monooxygenase YgiN
MNPNQLTIVVFIQAKQSTKQRVREELTQLAARTRTEAGNINYDLHVSNTDDSLFIIYENWKDQAALDSHMNEPYLKSFLGKTDELLAAPVDGTICKKL